MSARRPDALRTLRSTHKKLGRCVDAVRDALRRPAEVRLLELQQLAQVSANLTHILESAMKRFQVASTGDGRD